VAVFVQLIASSMAMVCKLHDVNTTVTCVCTETHYHHKSTQNSYKCDLIRRLAPRHWAAITDYADSAIAKEMGSHTLISQLKMTCTTSFDDEGGLAKC